MSKLTDFYTHKASLHYSHTDCATMLNATMSTPLDGRQLKPYIASMREVVEAYKKNMLEMIY